MWKRIARSSFLFIIIFLVLIPGVYFYSSRSPGFHCQEARAKVEIKSWCFAVYSDNRGGNKLHREVLKSLKKINPDIILNGGDIFYKWEKYGSIDAFKKDIEQTWGKDGVKTFWNRFYPCVGGHDETYFGGKEGDNEAGKKLLEAFDIKVGNKGVISMSKWGDYYFSHKGVNFIILYRSDVWPFKKGQADWFEERLKLIRKRSPKAGIVVYAHDGGWFNPHITDGEQFSPKHSKYTFRNGIKDEKARLEDQVARHRIHQLMIDPKYKVDLALGADFHDYYVAGAGTLLKLRTGSPGYGEAFFLKVDVRKEGFLIQAKCPDGKNLFNKVPQGKDRKYHPWEYRDVFPDEFPSIIFKPYGGKFELPKG